jgi:hypothetical protein
MLRGSRTSAMIFILPPQRGQVSTSLPSWRMRRDEPARARSRRSGSRFLLLSRQVQYGCLASTETWRGHPADNESIMLMDRSNHPD